MHSRRTLATFTLPAATALVVSLSPLVVAQPAQRHHTHAIDRVQVPAGEFVMGSDSSGEPDEHPQHRARVGAFSIDRREVSRRQWNACIAAGACTATRSLGARFEVAEMPVVGVSWHQARAYCAWTGARLPTEVEWEKAARGTDGRTFPWGEARPTSDLAVFGRDQHTGTPDPVGTHPRGASPYGVLDIAGNVWEWTESPYDPYAHRHPATAATCETALSALADLRSRGIQGFTGTNPLPRTCERTLRGGSWNYGGAGLRVTNRVHHGPEFQLNVAGVRCAVSRR